MSPIDQPAIPKGSTVLVSGVNGLLGSNIADQFLNYGYNVRGTARNPTKDAWLGELFSKKYGARGVKFEVVAVPDMEQAGAYNEAVKGCSAVIHTAARFSMNPNPHEVVPAVIAGTVNALEAAAKEPSVKRFVLTSSSASALLPKANTYTKVTTETWNDEIVDLVYGSKEPYDPHLAYPVYCASKTLSEKEAWKFMTEKQPGFVFNAVLPNINFGASLDPVNQGYPSTIGMVAALFKGDSSILAGLPAQYFVDVTDTGILHVAAAIHPDVKSERVFAFAEPENGNKVLSILRKLYPTRTFPADFQSDEDLSEIVPRQRAEELLRDMGKDGFTSLEESLRNNTKDLA